MGQAFPSSDPLHIVKSALAGNPTASAVEELASAIREVRERLQRGRRECPSLDLSDDVLRLADGTR